jgi:hypothetical protein
VRHTARDGAAERVTDERDASQGLRVGRRRTTADRPLARLAQRLVGGDRRIESSPCLRAAGRRGGARPARAMPPTARERLAWESRDAEPPTWATRAAAAEARLADIDAELWRVEEQ